MRARLGILTVVLSICFALLAVAAPAATAAQRVELKVLLLGSSGTEPSFTAWEAQLRREGVPYDAIVTLPEHTSITAETLSYDDEGVDVGRYQAVILAVGGLIYCDGPCNSTLEEEEWSALLDYEDRFNVRQLSAYVYPSPAYGLEWPARSGALEGAEPTLTEAGRSAFPYLDGTVTVDAFTYGYLARPLEGFTTLLSDEEGYALVGTVTHEDGREEMVQTFDGNPYQLHTQLLRHGQLAWVTRGTFLGSERTYLELHVDDTFLPDDIWDPVNNVTDYDPEDAVRMTATDVTAAVEWSRETGLRLDQLFNGAGSDQHAEQHEGEDPLLRAFQEHREAFLWVNHTFSHPNVDCSTRTFIVEEIEDNVTWARGKGFALDPDELVTGEHSGLANLIPGSPGTIDPPYLDESEVSASGGTLAAGRYDYAVTATSTNGETIPSTTTLTVPGEGSGSAVVSWEAICHATTYKVYRRTSPSGEWALLRTIEQPERAFTDAGAAILRYTDTGGAGGEGEPPSANGAAIDPYGQNPNMAGALESAGITNVGTDTSKPYPITPTDPDEATYPAGSTWVQGEIRAIPRYPTNVYYNVATQEQLVDEFNYIYLPPELGGICVDTEVTTCRSEAASWEDVEELESQRIFGHMMGNDPRPHYFHQTNIAVSEDEEGAVLYPILDAMLDRYEGYFNETVPIVQLDPTEIAEHLARQEAWAAAQTSDVSGYIEGSSVIVENAGAAVEAPISGTEFGTLYGGTRSGWDYLPRGRTELTAAVAWPEP